MKELFLIKCNYGGQMLRKFVFIKDLYGHNRINIGVRGNFLIETNEIKLLCKDDRFEQNAYIGENRIFFNGLKPEDLTPEEFEMYKSDLNL